MSINWPNRVQVIISVKDSKAPLIGENPNGIPNNILITGIKGQLGREIIKTAPRSIYGEKINLILVNRNKLDLSNAYECGKLIREYK